MRADRIVRRNNLKAKLAGAKRYIQAMRNTLHKFGPAQLATEEENRRITQAAHGLSYDVEGAHDQEHGVGAVPDQQVGSDA